MDRPISRRDFLDGVALSTVAAWRPGRAAGPYPDETDPDEAVPGEEDDADGYPPEWQGLQGNTADAMAVPHALRDGRFWRQAGAPAATGERYDLVVVGAGISGIAAAYRWWRRDPEARILVLDNHDDFGGRARRNEFRVPGRPEPLIGYGGSPTLPASPTPEAAELLAELGLDAPAGGPGTEPSGARVRHLGTYPSLRPPAGHDPLRAGFGAADASCGRARYRELGMREAVFCDRESFGVDRLVPLRPGWTADLPMPPEAAAQLSALLADPPDWWPGASPAEKRARLARLSYAEFLREVCRARPEVVRFCHTMPVRDRARTADMISALDALTLAGAHTFPGLTGLGLSPPDGGGAAVQLFPDGNHGLVRALIRRMIPGVAPGSGDATLTRFDYDRLDLPGNRVRIRLSSPVVLVRNDGPAATATSATVGYFDGEAVRTVRAGAVVLACWHAVIPYLVPDLPPDRRAALRRAVRAPVLHATVRLRDWRSWHAAGIDRVRFTGAYWSDVALPPAPRAGGGGATDPAEPITAHLVRLAVKPGMDPRAGAVAGRRELAAVPYRYLEFTVREQLARLLGGAGFDPARDIQGLTINRWAHGVPLGPGPDPAAGPSGAEAGRRFGRIVIAGSDHVPEGGADAAITVAHRAVAELRAEAGR